MAYLVLALTGVLAVDGYLSFRRQVGLFDEDQESSALRLGKAMRHMIASVWQTRGADRALQIIQDADEEDRRVRIRWVWIDAAAGDPRCSLAIDADLDTVAHGQDHSFKGNDAEGHAYRYTYIPVATGGTRQGALEISESLEQLNQYSRATLRRELISTGVLVLVGGATTLLLGVHLVGRPLQLLANKTHRIGSGDLSGPLHLKGPHELTELADAMNLMCDRLADAQEKRSAEAEFRIATLEQLRHADRLTTLGRLASGIAHELGTPLNVVSGRAGFIASGELSNDETKKNAEIIRSQAERMAAVIRRFLDFARRSSPQRTQVDLCRIAQQSVEFVESLARKLGAEISLECKGPLITACVDPEQIQQVLTNLLVNALEAMPGGGHVGVRLEMVKARAPERPNNAETDCLRIEVEDDGEGIPEEARSRLFDPFFTTKEVGVGTGLGLSIAQGIVHDHGGWIEVSSKIGEGSRFTVYLPQRVEPC